MTRRLYMVFMLGVVLLAAAAIRPSAVVAQDGGTDVAVLAGPFSVVRGQSARVSVLSPAALYGTRRRVDLKFIVDFNLDGFRIIKRSFVLDQNRASAAIEIVLSPRGEVMFEGQTLGVLPADVVSIDIAGHEITHGVTGRKPGTISSLQIVETDTGKVTVAIPMAAGDSY